MSLVEENILQFLRGSFRVQPSELKGEFIKLLSRLKDLENNPHETRAFSYLDIISWLESKISGVPVGEVIRAKYLQRMEEKREPEAKRHA